MSINPFTSSLTFSQYIKQKCQSSQNVFVKNKIFANPFEREKLISNQKSETKSVSSHSAYFLKNRNNSLNKSSSFTKTNNKLSNKQKQSSYHQTLNVDQGLKKIKQVYINKNSFEALCLGNLRYKKDKKYEQLQYFMKQKIKNQNHGCQFKIFKQSSDIYSNGKGRIDQINNIECKKILKNINNNKKKTQLKKSLSWNTQIEQKNNANAEKLKEEIQQTNKQNQILSEKQQQYLNGSKLLNEFIQKTSSSKVHTQSKISRQKLSKYSFM